MRGKSSSSRKRPPYPDEYSVLVLSDNLAGSSTAGLRGMLLKASNTLAEILASILYTWSKSRPKDVDVMLSLKIPSSDTCT